MKRQKFYRLQSQHLFLQLQYLWIEKIKKQIRDGNEVNQLELVKELGDVLFYVTALANHIGSDLQTVATNNIAKLQDRQKRNTLKGSGNNR